MNWCFMAGKVRKYKIKDFSLIEMNMATKTLCRFQMTEQSDEFIVFNESLNISHIINDSSIKWSA